MLEELDRIHEQQVAAFVLFVLTLGTVVGVGTATWAVLKYAAVA